MSSLASFLALKKLKTCKNTNTSKNMLKCTPVSLFQCSLSNPMELCTLKIYGPLNKIMIKTIIWKTALTMIKRHI